MPKPTRITWRCGRRILGIQREPATPLTGMAAWVFVVNNPLPQILWRSLNVPEWQRRIGEFD